MQALPYIAVYGGVALFILATVRCFLRWAKMPMHMRWELYPVAHEAEKAHYGGSYLEDKAWWKQPRSKSIVGELKVMIPEIVFLVALKEHNKKLWTRSFPFHFGLYLVVGATVLMFVGGILGVAAPATMEGAAGGYLQGAVAVLGVAGLALGLLGALGLLHRRMTDPDLVDFTASADIFNLVFFIVAFGAALGAFAVSGHNGAEIMTFSRNLFAGDFQAIAGATGAALYLPIAATVLLSVLMAYIPMTHMSHFVGKYFAYHAIRWNDEPNLEGGEQEEVIQGLLGRPVSWAAAHIGADGKRTWADVATDLSSAQDDDDKKGKKGKKSKKEKKS